MSSKDDPDSLIADIYDTVVDRDRWPDVLERFADLIGGDASMLMWQDQMTGAGEALTARLDPAAPVLFFSHFAALNPLRPPPEVIKERMRNFVPRLILDEDRISKTDLMRTEFYNDFLRRFDIHSTLSIGLAVEGMTGATVDITRPARRGPFTEANLTLSARIQPHLIRAFDLGRKVAATRRVGDDLSRVFDQSPRGLVILGGDRRLRYMNPAAEGLIAGGHGLTVRGERLVVSGSAADQRLGGLIARAATQCGARTGGGMALISPNRTRPLSVTVSPLSARTLSIFEDGPSVLVSLTDLDAESSLSEQRLQYLFGLSRAEARVASALLKGLDPRRVAECLGLSVYTVRGHLIRIFEKTGVHGQVDLVRLLMRAI
jgi:DNA-binding CsgD family transcriptional regulator/PAS domain-containing protein